MPENGLRGLLGTLMFQMGKSDSHSSIEFFVYALNLTFDFSEVA